RRARRGRARREDRESRPAPRALRRRARAAAVATVCHRTVLARTVHRRQHACAHRRVAWPDLRARACAWPRRGRTLTRHLRVYCRAMPSWKTIAREPLVHFLAIGALLFAVDAWRSPADSADDTPPP